MKLSDFVQGLILVALKAEAEREPPKEFLVFPYGTISSEKGIFKFTPEACDALLAERAQHSADVQIDYDHLAIKSEKPGDGKAAGWCKLEKRDDGLWAVGVKWTPVAAEMLRSGEYRYFSPYFGATKDEKLIVLLMNIAITNLPAMHQIEALVAASRLSRIALARCNCGCACGCDCDHNCACTPACGCSCRCGEVAVAATIKKGGDGKFRLYSEDGKKLLGTHDTLESAKKQESAINISKAREAGHHIPKKEARTTMANKLGGYLARHLKEKGLALKALADGTGIHEDRVRELHDGADPTAEEMATFAKLFGMKSADELEEQMEKVCAGTYNGGEVDPRAHDSDEESTPAGRRAIAAGGMSRKRERVTDEQLEEAALTLTSLTGTADPTKQREFLDGLVALSKTAKANDAKLKALEADREKMRMESLIKRGKDEGKLIPSLIRHYLKRPPAELESFLEAAPQLPTATLNLQEAEPSQVANILTTEEIEVCRMSNVPVEQMAKFALDQRAGKTKQLIYDSYRTAPTK